MFTSPKLNTTETFSCNGTISNVYGGIFFHLNYKAYIVPKILNVD